MAKAGIEPSSAVLETDAIPLGHEAVERESDKEGGGGVKEREK